MTTVDLLRAPERTQEDRPVLIDLVLAVRKSCLQDLLKKVKLARTGTKPQIRSRIEEAVEKGHIRHETLVEFLDSVCLWGKQHVFLFDGPRYPMDEWKNPEQVHQRLKQFQLDRLFNAHLPLVLPEPLTLSSIAHTGERLRVTAVRRDEYDERAPQHDAHEVTNSGEQIRLRAYKRHVSRILVSFEWDLVANIAMLQITQLRREVEYEEAAQQFWALLRGWLDIERFASLDVRPVIRRLQDFEASGTPEVRSHGIHYRTLRGRRLSAQSPGPRDSVLGETGIDEAMRSVAREGVGHLGNFFWLGAPGGGPTKAPSGGPASAASIRGDRGSASNPLGRDVRVVIVASKGRIHFTTPNNEEAVRYVLSRVRSLR